MRILAITNLYPPHHAGTYDFRCQDVVEALRKRGHEVRVLTSNHGLKHEQRDADIERCLRLNGVFGHPDVTDLMELKEVEFDNNRFLNEAIASFKPDVIHVWSLHGLSKSLIFSLHRSQLPVVYDVSDDWISRELRRDPWLDWWNREKLSLAAKMQRTTLEVSGQRDKWDELAPTRDCKETKRLSFIYDPDLTPESTVPNSIPTFRFERIYFCSQALKEETARAGFQVEHGEVIYAGIPADHFLNAVKPAAEPAKRLLLAARLDKNAGAMTALKALLLARKENPALSLTIYGQGDSDYVAQLRSFAVRNELPVEFPSVADPFRDMPGLCRQHDIFLHTLEWPEPCVVTPLEAMVGGIPVIGTRMGSVGELLRDGENALLFASGDEKGLAARILEMASQPDLRLRVASAGQSEAYHYWNEEVMVEKIEQYLLKAIPAAK